MSAGRRRRRLRVVASAVAAVAAAAVVAACSGSGSSARATDTAAIQQALPGVSMSLVKAAEKEGTVEVYAGNWSDSTNAVVKGFNKLFPSIKVRIYTADTGTLRERVQAEEREKHSTADVYTDTDPGTLNSMVAEKFFLNYKVATDANLPAADKNAGYWYPLRIAAAGIAWNTDKVTEAQAATLSQWSSATDAAFKGKAGVVTPTSGGGIAYLPWYTWDKLYGDSFIQKVGALKPTVYQTITPAASALASGDISVLFGASETGLYPLYQQGAPIRWTLPSPGVGTPTGQAILAHAPHLNAAKLFQQYSFSKQGYEIWQTYTGIPAWTGMPDQRTVGKQSWYHRPTSFYSFSTADATEQMDHINSVFKQYVQ